jgi:phosphate transport system permease protein
LFGYLIFVIALGFSYSLVGGGVTLAIMILPVIVRSTEESLLAVPRSLREGSFALGSSKVRTIFSVVLPCASSGIVTSIILAIGRIISESAVLILTIGMVVNKMPDSFASPGTSLALDVYYFSSHGYPEQAAATGVVLLVLVVSINTIATVIGKIYGKGELADG